MFAGARPYRRPDGLTTFRFYISNHWIKAKPVCVPFGTELTGWEVTWPVKMPFTEFAPWLTLIETPPSVVTSGSASTGLLAGPGFVPKILKIEPCAITPPGKPGATKLEPHRR